MLPIHMFLLLNFNTLRVSVCAQTAETVLIWMADTFTAARWAHEQSRLSMRSDPPPLDRPRRLARRASERAIFSGEVIG